MLENKEIRKDYQIRFVFLVKKKAKQKNKQLLNEIIYIFG